MKIVLCGPPHAGKSCFRYGIKEAIRSIEDAPYPYFITGCPDGEGSWFQETASKYLDDAIEYKKQYKSKFTPEFVTLTSNSVKNCSVPLTLIDVGGIIDIANEEICKFATHSVILFKEIEDLIAWQEFCQKLDLTIIAEIKSDYQGVTDKVINKDGDGCYRGSVHYLERGDLSIATRPTVKKLAQIISGKIK